MLYRTFATATCAVLLAFGASIAAAQEKLGLYLGGSAGYSFVEDDDDVDIGDRVEDFDIDDEDFAWKGFVGFQFLPWLAVEGGYVDFGDVEDGSDVLNVDATLDGWDAFLVGNLPIAFIDVFAKVGVISWDLDVDVSDDVDDVDVSSDGEDLAYGVGAALDLGRLAIRAEAEAFDVGDVDDLFMLSVGATVHF